MLDSEFWAKYYKIRYGKRIPKGRTKMEIQFIQNAVKLKKSDKILDFSCGEGRHAIALGKLGYKVDGFDIDPTSIEEASNQVKLENLGNVNLRVADSTKLDIKDKYDLTICMYTSIGFMGEEGNKKAFDNLFASVKPGGLVILDLINKDWAIKNCIRLQEKKVEYEGDMYSIMHHRDILKNPWREHNHLSFTNKTTGEATESTYSLQLYDFNEVLQFINANGHRLLAAYGDYDMSQFDDKLQRFILVSQKD